jgi:hypothetical protein
MYVSSATEIAHFLQIPSIFRLYSYFFIFVSEEMLRGLPLTESVQHSSVRFSQIHKATDQHSYTSNSPARHRNGE